METHNNPLRPIGPFVNPDDLAGPAPEKEVKKFEAAKADAADTSKEDNVRNGGPQFRGPLEGGATGGSFSPRADKATGLDGGGMFFGGTWDFGGDGKLHLKDLRAGVTAHTDWMPGNGVGPGVKDGKPGVAAGDAKGGSVTTPGDAPKKDASSSSAAPAKGPEGMDWFDDKHRIKHDGPITGICTEK